jgi:hypothetical protein
MSGECRVQSIGPSRPIQQLGIFAFIACCTSINQWGVEKKHLAAGVSAEEGLRGAACPGICYMRWPNDHVAHESTPNICFWTVLHVFHDAMWLL